MKVSTDAAQATSNPEPAADSKPSGSKSFSKVLEQKGKESAEGSPGGAAGLKRPRTGDPNEQLAALAGLPIPVPLEFAGPSGPQAATHAGPPETALIQNLVSEILVSATPEGGKSVEVQFNSKTLAGLKVQITGTGDHLSIRFSTSSQSVSQLLSRNIGQLSQALEAKGLQIAPIQIEMAPPPAAPASSPQSGNSGRDNRRGQGDGRQQKQQK